MKLNERNYQDHAYADILNASTANVLELAFDAASGLLEFIKWCIANAPRGKRIKELQEQDQLILKALAELTAMMVRMDARVTALENKEYAV